MKSSRALLLLTLAATVASADPSGKRWATPPVTFHLAASVNNGGTTTLTGSEGILYSTALARMQAAFSNWTAAKVTACTTTWASTNGAQFATPSGTAAVNGSDNLNNVIFLGGPTPNNWRYSSGTLGLTTTGWFTNDPGTLVEADMELNDNVNWTDQSPGGQAGAFDYESVVLHEAGHFLGLDHTEVLEATMFRSAETGEISKRSLEQDDQGGLCAIYPAGKPTVTCVVEPKVAVGSGCACSSAAGLFPLLAGLSLLALSRRRLVR